VNCTAARHLWIVAVFRLLRKRNFYSLTVSSDIRLYLIFKGYVSCVSCSRLKLKEGTSKALRLEYNFL
jgi:hypothetical protein